MIFLIIGIKSKYVAELPIQRKTLAKPTKALESKPEECIEWRCVSSRPPPALIRPGVKPTLPPCPAPKCPNEYILKLENDELDEYDCPKYNNSFIYKCNDFFVTIFVLLILNVV